MTPDQYLHAIETLGLSQRAASAFIGVSERTGSRWAAGHSRIPESVSKLLRLMIVRVVSPEEVEWLPERAWASPPNPSN